MVPFVSTELRITQKWKSDMDFCFSSVLHANSTIYMLIPMSFYPFNSRSRNHSPSVFETNYCKDHTVENIIYSLGQCWSCHITTDVMCTWLTLLCLAKAES